MIQLNIGRLAPDVAALLWKAGAALPPLQWQSRANPGAKRVLDGIDDRKLFAQDVLQSEAMGAAVRSLLYLWNGWIGECSMCGQLAEPKERLYLAGLSERHLGHGDAAKRFFQQLEGHPVFPDLVVCAAEIMVGGEDASLSRLGEIASTTDAWEPCLFVDAYAQAMAGALTPRSQELVRQLQRKEFELLFSYCYRGATGEEVLMHVAASQASPRKPVKRVRRPSTRRSTTSAPAGPGERESTSRTTEEPRKPAKAVTGTFYVQCPKCGSIAALPGSACGKTGRCSRCKAYFVVPRRDPAVASAGS